MLTKILIIRFSSIGDIVLTTPVVRCLKEQVHGECEVHYLVKEQFVDILKENPHIDVIHVLKDSLKKVTEGLAEEGFHYVIDLHRNIRSNYVKKHLKGLSFTFNKLNVQKWILVNFNIDLLPDVHIVDRYFEAVKALGIENDNKGLDYFIPTNEEYDLSINELIPEDYIALCIGGAHGGKKLSVQQLSELSSMLTQKIVLIGGKEDVGNAEQIANGKGNVINLTGQLSINQSASVIRQSKLVITHDSGMMHIASAFKKKIISIWGATVPKFGMYPYLPDPDSVMISADHLKFRPTSKLGNKKSRKERRTTDEIDLQKIADAVDHLF